MGEPETTSDLERGRRACEDEEWARAHEPDALARLMKFSERFYRLRLRRQPS